MMIVLSACKKDAVNKSVTNGKTTPVTFSMGFTKSTGGFNGAANITRSKLGAHTLAVDTTLVKYASVIYVGVYTSDGNRLFLTKQLATDTTFGTVQYNLPPGTYTVTFAAGQTGMGEVGTTLTNTDISYSQEINSQTYDIWQSTFFQKMSLTVGSSSINQNVTLNRIDAQVVVNIEDAVPSNVKFIAIRTDDGGATEAFPFFSVNTGAVEPTSNDGYRIATTSTSTPVAAGTKNLQLAVFLVNVNRAHTIEIFAYDQLGTMNGNPHEISFNGTLVSYYINHNITLQAGHQTILSGKLFGGNGTTNTGGFQITVDPEWSPTTTTIPFQ